jgi:hypothetical protein
MTSPRGNFRNVLDVGDNVQAVPVIAYKKIIVFHF